jgi:hypothetical protein
VREQDDRHVLFVAKPFELLKEQPGFVCGVEIPLPVAEVLDVVFPVPFGCVLPEQGFGEVERVERERHVVVLLVDQEIDAVVDLLPRAEHGVAGSRLEPRELQVSDSFFRAGKDGLRRFRRERRFADAAYAVDGELRRLEGRSGHDARRESVGRGGLISRHRRPPPRTA